MTDSFENAILRSRFQINDYDNYIARDEPVFDSLEWYALQRQALHRQRQTKRQPQKSYNFTNTINAESKCPICLDSLLTDDKQELISLRCNHFFHKNCITSWCDRQQTCPICKDVIKLD